MSSVRFLRRLLVLLAAVGPAGFLPAQISLGQWRTHFSYQQASQVAYTGSLVYAVADGKLFSYDPSDELIEDYTALDGLVSGNVSLAAYNASAGKLLLVYGDGNMDILSPEGVTHLPDFMEKSFAADKTPTRLRMYGRHALLCTRVGLLLIDMQREEISETFLFRTAGGYQAVEDACLLDGECRIIVEGRLLKGRLSDNLSDASRWQGETLPEGLQPRHLTVWGDEWLLAGAREVYRRKGQAWEAMLRYQIDLSNLEVCGPLLALSSGGYVFELRREWGRVCRFEQPSWGYISHRQVASTASGSRLFTASAAAGLCHWAYDETSATYRLDDHNLRPNGPKVGTAWKLYPNAQSVLATGGGRWGDRYLWAGGLLRFQDEQWVSMVSPSDSIRSQTGLPFQDILSLAVDPADPDHVFACSWGEGVYEFQAGWLKTLHSHRNSPLVSCLSSQSDRYVRVDGAVFDPWGNLWVVNSDPTYGRGGLHVLTPQGRWHSPSYRNFPGDVPTWDDILFDSRGLVWINAERDKYGLFALDLNGTPLDESDDRSRWISTFTDQDGIAVDIFTVHCVSEDRSGALWIGTTHGPLILYHPQDVFDGQAVFNRVKVPRNDGTNEADYLLETSRVYAIAVDGANRKWIGTDNDGVYLLSSDGLETVYHFTTANSPMPSNVVYSVGVHPTTGEVFIGTESGLVSFKAEATEASSDYSTARAYPNPVTPDWEGPVVISGLMENSQVRIADTRGRVLAAGRSLGGQFVWNGKTPDGRRAASGVYLVFAADENGKSGAIVKIVMVN